MHVRPYLCQTAAEYVCMALLALMARSFLMTSVTAVSATVQLSSSNNTNIVDMFTN